MKEIYMRNETIAVLGCIHLPYQHRDAIAFVQAIRKEYKPDLWVNLGDEFDYHAISYHESNPDLYNSGKELDLAVDKYHTMFAKVDKMVVCESNHGSLPFRKALTSGLPKRLIKSYEEIVQAPKGHVWKPNYTHKLINGQYCFFTHGLNKDAVKVSKNLSMNVCQAHYHSEYKIGYWSNPLNLFWGLNVGCLVDDKSLAMAYNKLSIARPILGMALIQNGIPRLIPMILNRSGRWIGNVS